MDINNDRKLLGINTRNNFKNAYNNSNASINYNNQHILLNNNVGGKSNNDNSRSFLEIKEKKENYSANQVLQQRILGNNLYQTILTKYKLSKEDLMEHQLDELITKHNIGSNQYNVNLFVRDLKDVIQQNLEQKVNVNDKDKLVIENNQLSNKISDKSNNYFVSIDSNDRLTDLYPGAEHYKIDFGNKPVILGGNKEMQDKSISRNFMNVSLVKLIDVIIKPDDKLNYPYILLEIKELGGKIYGSNPFIDNCFAKLTYFKLINEYYYYKVDIEKEFNPPIDINYLTFNFKYPDGTKANILENSINLKLVTI
jgi:hypothetical protein